MIFNTLISLLAIAVSTSSTPIGPQELIVVTPHITRPIANATWPAGSNQIVTWETEDIPPASMNDTAKIVLGHRSTTPDKHGNSETSENLDWDHPLVNCTLGDGHANITVPNVPSGTKYIVVLFGDSGNASPEFTISEK
ncbi:hypothetical protein B0H11DRAFT_2186629 [Mycena galericulata]|nr:hypothetical protein B0H11DRAFT_2279114 [Mycena galericulata]KAJ7505137.1 hypothetical protein B0H11DRAFT_2186629 [Mycena galericulata]